MCIASIAVASAQKPACKTVNDFTKSWTHSEENKFWICLIWGVPAALTCPKGKVFDFAQQKCRISLCDIPCSDDSASLWPSRDATVFYACASGGAVEMSCPSTLKFGYEQQHCVWEHEWVNAC